MNKKNLVVNRIAAVTIALLLWQLVAEVINQDILLVGPLQVLLRLFSIWKEENFVLSICFTVGHIVGGFIIGLFVGLLFAALAYKFHWIETILWPWMATIKAVPVASFIVICLVWLSNRNLSIFISFLIVLPIVYQNMLTALRGIDESLVDLAKLENMGYFRKLRTVLIPQISSELISTVSITASMAWKAGVAAEIIGTPNGSMGKQLYLAKTFLDTDDLLAWTVIIVIVSVAFERLFVFVLKKILGEN